MESKNGTISSVETKSGMKNNKAWKMWMFTIDDQKFSTFDKNIGENFGVGEMVEMTGEQKGEFWNMKTMMPYKAIPSVEQARETIKAITPNPIKSNGQAAMYVSYAKDIYVALLNNPALNGINSVDETMTLAIDLVKQAQKAFI